MRKQPRYLQKPVEADLAKKMVFVGGPRQVGKTTMALKILGKNKHGYLNWDVPEDRERILKREFPDSPIWVFDEIHKYKHWRNLLKGLFDAHGKHRRILVTGSAMLDYYRRGGESLQGRYYYLRMHPLSVAELGLKTAKDFSELSLRGGFPEPYFSASEIEAKRWSRDYRTRLVQEDLRPLEKIEDLGHLELLMIRLPDLVGSPLSINALREDLQVSHKSVSNWLKVLERLYAIFRLAPFGASKLRAVKKEQKHYQYDWTLVDKPGARFENLVASHLLKWAHWQQDTLGREVGLSYFRDIDRREVDFIVTEKNRPIQAIECKWEDAEIDPGLRYFKAKFPDCEAWQISGVGTQDYVSRENIRVAPALKLLQKLA
ncbi:MAG: ATP-binding protein [Deltaproteobacteria bacterium]|nr:ATP-binding protein [Deltaproteobacteria bacterium]